MPIATQPTSDRPNAPKTKGLLGVMELVDILRGERGCPWDRKQTADTLSVYLIEEVYELVEAVGSGSSEAICEELGDVLFQLFFLSSLYRDASKFDIQDAADAVIRKMIRRHPHVFGNTSVENAEEVRQNWDRIKRDEKKDTREASILDAIPGKLPALLRAYRISERAARAGFDWSDMKGVLQKAQEEWKEFNSALRDSKVSKEGGDTHQVSLEFGDLLFTLVNVARFASIHPETALSDSIRKFEARFRHMEHALAGQGHKLEAVSRQTIDTLWENAKHEVG